MAEKKYELVPMSDDFVEEGEGNEDEIVERPEDAIPDLPENQKARDFLKKAPTKGLFMPLGKEVKVMQCWRCKAYGHRTGDRECPMYHSGNVALDVQRRSREDPMSTFVQNQDPERQEKLQRVVYLKQLLEEIREEERERKRRKMERKERKESKKSHHKDKKMKKEKKERKEKKAKKSERESKHKSSKK